MIELLYKVLKRKAINFSLSFLVSLTTFIFLQPKENHPPKIGFNTVVYNSRECYHIHHWMYMLTISIIMTFTTLVSKGNFTPPIVTILGILIGGSFSDLHYTNAFKIKTNCDEIEQYKSILN